MPLSRNCILIAFCFASLVAHAQNGNIRGRVTDQGTQQPLPYASVYINQTTVGTYTADDGTFVLTVEPRQYDVVISYAGYQSHQARVTVGEGETVTINAALKPGILKEMVVSSTKDEAWPKQLSKFSRLFLGTGAAAAQCKILNPWLLEFKEEKGGIFSATSPVPLEIENLYLGYRVSYDLRNFFMSPTHYVIAGYVRFTEMETLDSALVRKWKANRNAAYKGSSQHLMKAIVTGKVKEEEFNLYEDFSMPTAVRNANFLGNVDRLVSIYKTDSIVTPGKRKGWYTVKLPRRLEVHYVHRPTVAKVYRDIPYPVSWVDVKGGSLEVDGEGHVQNPLKMTVSGAMSDARIADILPSDYQPDQPIARYRHVAPQSIGRLAALTEMPYLHTDRTYYYTGETIWFKAHLRYYSPAMGDSLSRVLYVDLINPSGKVVATQRLPIAKGGADGNIVMPPGQPKGQYQLRAYTQWMLNFDPRFIYTKPVPVLADNEAVRPATHTSAQEGFNISIQPSKTDYQLREKITLTLQFQGDTATALPAVLSMAVTDLDQAVPVKNEATILTSPMPSVVLPDSLDAAHMRPIQYGIDIKGTLVNKKEKQPPGTVVMVQPKANDAFTIKTDEQGHFEAPALLLYDTAELFVQPKTQGLRGGSVVLDTTRSCPAPQPFDPLPLDIYTAATTRRQPLTDKPAKVLAAIEVSSTPLTRTRSDLVGQPDVVLNAEFFRTTGFTDALMAIQSRVAGMRIVIFIDGNGMAQKYIVFGGTSTAGSLEAQEPMVLIDGTVVNASGGGTAQQISFINPNAIARVEVIKYGNGAGLGARGANGIIAVYTEKGGYDKIKKRPTFYDETKLVKLNIPGYATPRSFVSSTADTSGLPDYRATIYWNPSVTLGKQQPQTAVSFYAADSPTRYRIVVEGLAHDGTPLHGEAIVTVKSQN